MVVQGIVESREDLAGLGRSVLRPYNEGMRNLRVLRCNAAVRMRILTTSPAIPPIRQRARKSNLAPCAIPVL